MKKKFKLIMAIVIVVALAAAGTAFAANGSGESVNNENSTGYNRGSERGTAQKFALQADQYETTEEFHAAILAQKMAIIEAKLADGSLSKEDAETIKAHLTSCDGTCEFDGENPNRPEEGWGIFGNGGQNSNSRNHGNGERLRSKDCDEETPLKNGSGNENGRGYRGGKND